MWARLLRMVVAPAFNPQEVNRPKGRHSVMLDGHEGSFLLSTAGPRNLLSGPEPVRWAWSANVRRSVTIDANGRQAIVRRWDSPDNLEEWPILREQDVRALSESFEQSGQPPRGLSVIDRGLKTFRAVRVAIEKQQGAPLDVILVFNTVLAWVASSDEDREVELEEAIRAIRKTRRISFTPKQISSQLLSYPLGDLVRLLRQGGSTPLPYLLDANLLIRHASGPLYQEAHKQLLAPPDIQLQRELFPKEMLIAGTEKPHAPAPSFVHHTPPTLARALVEVVLRFVEVDPSDGSLDILDPACGSGVFLIEAAREAGILASVPRTVSLRGFDKSEVAVMGADFCIRNANPTSVDQTVLIQQIDSLAFDDWGAPDIIATNPPFIAWERLSDEDRHLVQQTLGTLHRGRPDLSFAFIVRALQSLGPGGVLASLIPSSFLDGESAQEIREYILGSDEFQLRLIGHFRDFKYFDASVAPSFIIVSRSTRKTPIQIVTAESGFVDKAVRALRYGKPIAKAGYELYNLVADDLPADRWTPQPQRNLDLIKALRINTFHTVGDFFDPHLGIRPGNKRVFLVAEDDLHTLCPTKAERRFFRPIADRIEGGRVQPSGYVFYPYDTHGTLLLRTEKELKESVPQFYKTRLQPAEKTLRDRKSRYRKWWEVSEPVKTWLAAHTPRIVSQAFGRAGNFAFDSEGKYAIVQGVGWCWKHGDPTEDTMLAYVGILNSSVFDDVLSFFCPHLHGGQYQLYRQSVEQVPLPQLANDELRALLSQIGRAIAEGRNYDPQAQDRLVLRAYGLSPDRTPLDDAEHRQARVAREFRRLADEWEAETAVYSFVSQKTAHPTYRKIVNLGKEVIPHLIRDLLQDSPGYWSDALVELTGADPVPHNAETFEDIAEAWVRWGRNAGYDI